jgi:hypothetical protein
MKRSPILRILVITVLLALAAVLALSGFLYFRRGLAAGAGQHFIISIPAPVDQGRFPAFHQIPVESAVAAEYPITRLELWVNGVLLETHIPETARASVLHTWPWVPQYIGAHTLFVRAYDFKGNSTESNVVHVHGIQPAGFNILVPSEQVSSVAALAAEHETTTAAIMAQNPDLQLTAGGGVAAGQQVAVPVNPWAQAPAGFTRPQPEPLVLPAGTEPAQVVRTGPSGWGISDWLQPFTGDVLPEPPELQAGAEACRTQLLITDTAVSEDGFHVYRLHPNSNNFIRVATLAARELAGPLLYEEDSLPGTYQYYVTAFNAAGEAAGNIIQVSSAGGCQTGTVMPFQDLVDLPAGSDQAYFYYSLNGTNWQRYPGDENAFLSPGSIIDLGVLSAGSSQGSSLILGEAWAWTAGELEFAGLFGQQEVAPPDYAGVYVPSAGLIPETKLEVRSEFFEQQSEQDSNQSPISLCDEYSIQKYGWGICHNKTWDVVQAFSELKTTTFRWTPGIGANMGIWQVSLNPFPEDKQLDPPGIVMTGKTFGLGFGGLTTGQEGVFTIDLSQVDLIPLLEASEQAHTGQVQNLEVFDPFPPPWQSSPLSVENGLDQEIGGTVAILPAEVPVFNNMVYGEGLRRVYVRIIPYNNGLPAGLPSNTTTVYWDPEKPIPTEDVIDYRVRINDFYHMQIPERGLEFCVQITGVDKEVMQKGLTPQSLFGGPFSPVSTGQLYTTYTRYMQDGTPVCPAKHKPESMGFWDYLGDAYGKLTAAWNYVAKTYNEIKDKIDTWGAKLNPLCIQGEFIENLIDEDGNKVADSCKVGTSIATSAAMASVGLPPSLPTSEQLEEAAKDYAIDYAAEQAGVECDADCKALIKKEVDKVVQEVAENKSTTEMCISEPQAQYKGYKPLCLPPGVSWKPYPDGQFAPAVAVVEVFRPSTLPEGAAPPSPDARGCTLNVSLLPLQNDFWVGKLIPRPANIGGQVNTEGDWVGQVITSDQVQELHEPQSLPMPVLQPGESLLLPVTMFRSPYDYKLPGTEYLNLGRDYWLQYHGMTYKLEVSCGDYTAELSYPDPGMPPSIVPYLQDIQWQEVQP